MSDKFDDFFNEFFGNGKENNDKSNNDDKFDEEQNESVEKFINMISESDGNIEDTFGEPDEIEYFEEDNFYFERRIWNTVGGKIMKISMVEPPETPEEFHKFIIKPNVPIRHIDIDISINPVVLSEVEDLLIEEIRESLVKELDMAIADENYEKACIIRDQLNSMDDE